jgi:TonB family protein
MRVHVRHPVPGRSLALVLLAACTASAPRAPSAPAAEGAQRTMRVEQPPVLRADSPQPAYPAGQVPRGTTGRVLVRMAVTVAGTVDTTAVEVLESTHPAFTASVLAVLPRLRFQPGELAEMQCSAVPEGTRVATPPCRGAPRRTGEYVRATILVPFTFDAGAR